MPTTLRAATLMRFADLVQRRGVAPGPLLAQVGLNEAMLSHPDNRVPAQAAAELLELAAEVTQDPLLGLHLAAERQLSDIGALSLLVQHQPTLRQAIMAVLQYQHLSTYSVLIRIEDMGPLAIFHLTMAVRGPARQANELMLAASCRWFTEVLGDAWTPLQVCFTHEAPPHPGLHRALLGCPVQFDADFNGIVCRADDLDRVNPQADASMARYAQQLMDSLPAATSGSLLQEARKSIYMLLPSGRANGDQVAQSLGMSPRTLQRRLQAAGTSYQYLLDEVRRDLAARYTVQSPRALGDISAQLGFRNHSAFSRWFLSQFGVSPQAWRERHRVAKSPAQQENGVARAPAPTLTLAALPPNGRRMGGER